MIRKNQLFQFGLIIGMIMLIAQGILTEKISIPILILIYIFIIIIPILLKRTRISIGIILGYFLSFLIFIVLVYVAYNILFYFTKL
jgi:hypothetical protein